MNSLPFLLVCLAFPLLTDNHNGVTLDAYAEILFSITCPLPFVGNHTKAMIKLMQVD